VLHIADTSVLSPAPARRGCLQPPTVKPWWQQVEKACCRLFPKQVSEFQVWPMVSDHLAPLQKEREYRLKFQSSAKRKQ